MPRCTNCGKENPDTICASCLHHRKKQDLKAAENPVPEPAEPSTGPDLDDLRDRFRRIQEGLSD